ncbi:MAG: PKD domain-containing protein, partial [Thermoplasmata archaeon]
MSALRRISKKMGSQPVLVAIVTTFLLLGAAFVLLGGAPAVQGKIPSQQTVTPNAATQNNSSGGLAVSVMAGPTNGTAPLTTFFNTTVQGGVAPYTYAWTFGDGGNGTGAWIIHTYTTPGIYTAIVRVADSSQLTGTGSAVIVVGSGGGNSSKVIALNFSASAVRGNAPFSPDFTVSATGGTPPYNLSVCPGYGACFPAIDQWSGSSESFVAHYPVSGNFTASASVADSAGDVAIGTIPITVDSNTPLNVSVLQSLSNGTAPLAVGFLATVSGGTAPYTIQWVWGDGSFGSSTNGGIVAHAYKSVGVYTPTLIVRDAANGSVTHALGVVDVTSNSTVSSSRGGGLLPSGDSGTTAVAYLGVAAGAAIVSAVG